jgi:uncharacterized secreted protein with C-terminal beta-propeller domain
MKTRKSQRSPRHHGDTSPTRIAGLGALLAAGLLVGACNGDQDTEEGPPTYDTSEYRLTAAPDCDALRQRVVESTTERALENRYHEMFLLDSAEGGGRGNSAPPDASDSPDDYTTTNVQEEGVDEVDIVKTDGEFIYTVNGDDLVIVDSWPAEQTHEVGRFDLDGDASDGNVHSHGLFLHDDRVAVFSNIWNWNRDEKQESFSGTRVTILDVSDRSAPTLLRTVDLEGWFQDARMIDGEIYAVSNARLRLPHEAWDYANRDLPGLPEASYEDDEAERTRKKNIARPILRAEIARDLQNVPMDDLMPRERVLDDAGSVVATRPMYQCSDVYLPPRVADPGILNVIDFSIDATSTDDSIDATGLLARGWELYASKENLYIAMSSRSWWWGWGERENETHLHKFELDAQSGPIYRASGRVDGWLLNQFSMSEHAGHLRVATTDNDWTWNEQTGESEISGGNHLIVLKEQGGELVETGSVRDLAPGERIYSARFMGDTGYMVTFRQVDPLYTFDLSDPTNPKMLGELKINGFSSYIHPLGDDHLLTIGRDADDQGQVMGVHLQIFDVSDLHNPVRTHQEKISTGSWSSWSEAMWDHHAFTYHPEKGVLAFPINIYDWENDGADNFTGLLVYNATAADGFSEIGRVGHADLVQQDYCLSNGFERDCNRDYGDNYHWWVNMRRSIFIEDYLYSLSDYGLKVNDLLQPANEHARVLLRQ